jgi:signal transduction histidine kinase
LFQKFAKGVRSKGGRGTGLGLSIVRELARMQGGDASYAPGSGFVVRMPAAD